MPIRVVVAQQKAQKKNEKRDYEKVEKAGLLRQIAEAHQQIEQMQTTIDQLLYRSYTI